MNNQFIEAAPLADPMREFILSEAETEAHFIATEGSRRPPDPGVRWLDTALHSFEIEALELRNGDIQTDQLVFRF
ncbi:MAG: hypothetical protein JWM11_2285 [Planctomycetaceae bacterium]|nr:hypothetical protein [Planctomycetaceae bacterium]